VSARERILSRVRDALADRPTVPHPGAFGGWRPTPLPASAVEGFVEVFTRAGGEVHRAPDAAAAVEWIRREAAGLAGGSAVGATVPPYLDPGLPPGPPETASLGISMASAAVGETGSLVLDARDGRRTQLLPPVHVVLVRVSSMHRTLVEALEALRADLPSALGLHSGPSKSADIGQVLVKGVHGPGRVVAILLEE
jgi:L-lactate dehydrogenase complex protein LldG